MAAEKKKKEKTGEERSGRDRHLGVGGKKQEGKRQGGTPRRARGGGQPRRWVPGAARQSPAPRGRTRGGGKPGARLLTHTPAAARAARGSPSRAFCRATAPTRPRPTARGAPTDDKKKEADTSHHQNSTAQRTTVGVSHRGYFVPPTANATKPTRSSPQPHRLQIRCARLQIPRLTAVSGRAAPAGRPAVSLAIVGGRRGGPAPGPAPWVPRRGNSVSLARGPPPPPAGRGSPGGGGGALNERRRATPAAAVVDVDRRAAAAGGGRGCLFFFPARPRRVGGRSRRPRLAPRRAATTSPTRPSPGPPSSRSPPACP